MNIKYELNDELKSFIEGKVDKPVYIAQCDELLAKLQNCKVSQLQSLVNPFIATITYCSDTEWLILFSESINLVEPNDIIYQIVHHELGHIIFKDCTNVNMQVTDKDELIRIESKCDTLCTNPRLMAEFLKSVYENIKIANDVQRLYYEVNMARVEALLQRA